ncbi:uncharacterized protein PITG_10927 [Phytophthora infestans T30-4]|uniref:Uncharacterized protein n=1 Tax=Phytophthora infestans (strain T30-4) TaxID=403677 RepID=D0NFR8_PHYIT|nr:uncharacterized protein PITG_10927 [Phytophthora infestans T30-4]EEY57119.1 conserved hypothetical protein [Phytophthora infestans T30-4]|eukprot:XP_002901729.1 conserved hypothetical protein [Phytophthora infestans T30-4]
MLFTDQQCQTRYIMKNMKTKWASAREDEGRTGNCGPIRRPKHYSIMKDYWGDATGMNNRPHLSAENMDTIAAACDAVIRVKRTQGECVEANLGAVAKGFSEGLVVLGKGLADKQTELFQIQSDRAHAQTLQLLEQIETQSEQLRQQNQNMRELLNLIRHRN